MESFSQLVKDLGISAALVIAMMWFGAKVIWPWLTKQLDDSTKERQSLYAKQENVTERLVAILETHNRQSREVVNNLVEIRKLVAGRPKSK